MNNLVEIQYKNSSKYPEIFINGEKISRYMSLSDYIYDDLFRWVDNFYEIIDAELAESYHVVIKGHPYHALVLKVMQNRSEYCERIIFEEVQHRISIADKYAYIKRLQQRNNEKVDIADGIAFQCVDPEQFVSFQFSDVNFSTEPSEYFITKDAEEGMNAQNKYCIILSDKNLITKKKNQTILHIREEDFSVLIDYFLNYHVRLVKIEELFAKYASCITDKEVKAEFEAYQKEEYRVYMVKQLPTEMNIGDKVDLVYKVFPDCFPKNGVSVKVSNPSVLHYENGKLIAKEAGSCVVSICENLGHECVSATIQVNNYRYATNISIVLPCTSINIGESLRFRCIVTPTDAMDINEIAYSISDERVAVMSAPNELYALSEGRVCVTVSTSKISRKFYITVLPKAHGIVVSSEKIVLPFAAEAVVYGAITPANVVPAPALKWYLPNEHVVRIKSADSNKCCIESVNVGKTVLVCCIENTDIQKRIEIVVPKTRGCYVATSVYGSYDCSEVWVLRRFRDDYLSKRWFGRLFINVYYAVSPTIVKMFGKRKWFNAFWKKRLDKMTNKLKEKGYQDTPYWDD